MIKYSLIVLAATAVIMSSGCDDSECCATGNPPVAVISDGSASGTQLTKNHTESKPLVVSSYTLSSANSKDTDNNGQSANQDIVKSVWSVDGKVQSTGYNLPSGLHEVCLTVTDSEGEKDKTCGWVNVEAGKAKPVASFSLPSTCTPGEVINLSGNGTDSDGTVTGYSWSVGSTATTANTTITCPTSGSQEVCLVVTDNDGQNSNKVCHTTAPAVVADCKVIATPNGGSAIDGVVAGASTGTLAGGTTYTFTHNCPGTCTWETLQSTKVPGDFDNPAGGLKTCILDGDVNSDQSSHVPDVTPTSATINVNTCNQDWKEIKVQVKCTSPSGGTTNYFGIDNQ